MKKLITLATCLLALNTQAATLPVLGEGSAFPVHPYQDNEPVRILIDPELNGSTQQKSFTFTADFQNLLYQPDKAAKLPSNYGDGTRVPNAGHTHVYASKVTGDFYKTNVFLGAPSATLIDEDTLSFDITLPETGLWLLQVEVQYDDHTSRITRHPQTWRASDVAFVNITDVIPEPGSMSLMAIGGLLLLRRKR